MSRQCASFPSFPKRLNASPMTEMIEKGALGPQFARCTAYILVNAAERTQLHAIAEQKTLTKVFTLCHVMLGATVMVGLLALFAEAVVSDAGSVANAEFALAKLLSSFRRNDANGDGYMYAADLRGALEQIGIICTEEEFKDIFVQFDDNNDGRISSEEFIKALRPHLALQSRTCEGTSVADAIRTMALTARQHGDSSVVERLKRWAMGMSRLLSEHKAVRSFAAGLCPSDRRARSEAPRSVGGARGGDA